MSFPPRRRMPFLAVGAAAVVLTSVGCTGMPRTSEVTQGRAVGDTPYRQAEVKYNPPTRGLPAEKLVEEFFSDNWQTDDASIAAAKAYMTPEAARRWDPRSGIAIHGKDVEVQMSGNRATVTSTLVATVDAEGRYHAAAPGTRTRASVTMTRVDGEWRIASLPGTFGTWLTQSEFTASYDPASVFFADQTERRLVDDRRWFPRGEGRVTALARAQLGAIPGYLGGAVMTALPEGTTLVVDAIPVVDGVAEVNLSQAPGTSELRRIAWAQMFAALTQVPGVRAVALSRRGEPIAIDGVGSPVTSLEALGFPPSDTAPRAIVLRRGTVLQAVDFTGWLGDVLDQRPIDDTFPAVPERWVHLATSLDRSQIAGIDADRSTLHRWTPRGSGSPPAFGTNLTEPNIDSADRLWIAGTDREGRPQIWWLSIRDGLDPATPPAALNPSWVRGRIVGIKASPGARRLAVAVEDEDGAVSVLVSGLSLSQVGRPVEIRTPLEVASGLRNVRDLTWTGDGGLAVIGSWGDDEIRPILLPLGEAVTPLAPVADAADIMMSGNSEEAVVRSSDGSVWRQIGRGWHRQDQVDELIVPGN